MDDFLNDDMKERLKGLMDQFGRPLTEAEKRKWLYGIEETNDEVSMDDMLNLMTGSATSQDQAATLAQEADVPIRAAQILQRYYDDNRYARPNMDTNWRSLDYLQRATGLSRDKISKILKTLKNQGE